MNLDGNVGLKVARKSSREAVEAFLGVLEGRRPPRELRVVTSARHETWSSFSAETVRQTVYAWLERVPFERVSRIAATWDRNVELKWEFTPKALTDDLAVTGTENDRALAEDLLGALGTHYAQPESSAAVASLLPEGYREYATAMEASLAQRLTTIDGIYDRVLELQDRLAKMAAERTRAEEAAAQKRRDELEKDLAAQRHAADDELRKQREELAQRERTVTERESAAERRDPRAVRKALQAEMTTLLEAHKEFTLSDETAKTRKPVHVAAVAGLVVAVVLWVVVALNAVEQPSPTLAHVSVLVSASVFLALTAWFYFRFLASWFRGRAEVEGGVRALREDMLRAQWLVEIMFEWTSREGDRGRIPWDVLRRLSHGLFARTPVAVGAKHPMDDVAERMWGLRRVKVDRDGAEVVAQKPKRKTES